VRSSEEKILQLWRIGINNFPEDEIKNAHTPKERSFQMSANAGVYLLQYRRAAPNNPAGRTIFNTLNIELLPLDIQGIRVSSADPARNDATGFSQSDGFATLSR
jgi:hypothetical protein